MKKLLSLFVAFIATTALWASNTITYTADQQLSGHDGSLDVDAMTFGPAITSHTFSNGTGTITCSGEITTIGEYAFRGCGGLTSITIPSSVTTIGNGTFEYCSGLTSITIPNSVTTFAGWHHFNGCTSLPIIDNIRYADTYLIEAVDKSLSTCTIKEGTKWIGDYAFEGCEGLKSITIPNSVTTIGDYAFFRCSGLISITIPNSITEIRSAAFYWCSGLTSVTIPNSLATIQSRTFEECRGLTSVTIPNSVTTIEDRAFYGCRGLTSITIPNSVTQIGDNAFGQCTKMMYPVYNANCFAYMPESYTGAYTIPYGIKQIVGCAFSACRKLTSITIPNSVTTIGTEAFYYCTSLTSVTIPNSVTEIEGFAFDGCNGLTSITIGNSVTRIGWHVFENCTGLTSMICYATNPPTCGEPCFARVDTSIPIYVPAQSVDAYKQADEWKNFTNILPIAAEEVPVTDPIITPNDHSVTITWPQTANADTYTIEIKKGSDLFCTLTFNAQGIMINITFAAPARGGERTTSAAELTVNGYKFTVTGLEQGTEYTYAVIAKDASAQPIQTYNGSFKTTEPTGLEDLTIDKKVGNKFIYGNQLYLRRGDKVYNAAGVEL